jgi:hypothetical protein
VAREECRRQAPFRPPALFHEFLLLPRGDEARVLLGVGPASRLCRDQAVRADLHDRFPEENDEKAEVEGFEGDFLIEGGESARVVDCQRDAVQHDAGQDEAVEGLGLGDVKAEVPEREHQAEAVQFERGAAIAGLAFVAVLRSRAAAAPEAAAAAAAETVEATARSGEGRRAKFAAFITLLCEERKLRIRGLERGALGAFLPRHLLRLWGSVRGGGFRHGHFIARRGERGGRHRAHVGAHEILKRLVVVTATFLLRHCDR